jgi:hypothetical protein
LYSQLISPVGAVSGATYVGTAGGNYGFNGPAFGTTNFLAVWDTGRAIRGRFINTNGTPAASDFLIRTKYATVTTEAPVSVAFDGVHSRFLVAWSDESAVSQDLEVFGQLVAADGAVTGNPMPIAQAAGDEGFPSIAFDGDSFLISWVESIFAPNACFRYRWMDSHGGWSQTFSVATPVGAVVPFANSVCYGGNQFLTIASFDFSDEVSGEVYGAFIPKSATLPHLEAAGSRGGTPFTLRLSGTPGLSYSIQAITNLGATNWTSLTTQASTNGSFYFTDTQAANASRFYRAVKQ